MKLEDKIFHQFGITQKQIRWINLHVIGKWKCKDGIVNVQGSVNFANQYLTSIPVQFGKVSGYFNCFNNQLTTLKGCPSEVGGDFYCDHNQLTSLDHVPTKIGGLINIGNNPFILNDKLFRDIKALGDRRRIYAFSQIMNVLLNEVEKQFGITDQIVVAEIKQSYIDIYENA